MPQKQTPIPLTLKEGTQRQATTTGNNAAWVCVCGGAQPLLGRSGLARGVTDGLHVDCPACGRHYFVVPDGGDYKTALRVEEI